MAKILSMDLGTNSIGGALVDTSANKIIDCGVRIFPEALPAHTNERRRIARQTRRKNYRFTYRFLLSLYHNYTQLFYSLSFIDKAKKIFPVFIHALLSVLFVGSLLMALINAKDFQFWFNLAITVLLGWIALKK